MFLYITEQKTQESTEDAGQENTTEEGRFND